MQSAPGRKSSSRTHAKTSSDKEATAKASNHVVSSALEPSPRITSANKQNRPFSQRRRFYHIRINGSLKPQSASTESDQTTTKGNSRNEYRRQQYNSFRPKNKGPIKTQEPPAPAKSMENLTHSEKTRQKHFVPAPPGPGPLCSHRTRVSQYNICPARTGTSTEPPVLSVPAVTLVA